MMQTSNNPVVLMVKPDVIMVQEIKVIPAKAKVSISVRCSVLNTGLSFRLGLMISFRLILKSMFI